MRWLSVLLLVVIGALWWLPGWMGPPNRHLDQQGLLPRVSSLKIVAPQTSGTEVSNKVCVIVGWFDTDAAAREAGGALSGGWQVSERERTLPPLHWVLIPPQPPEAAREQFQALYADGVEAYLVAQGEYRNAISLGLFESRAAAESVLAEKKQQNPNVILANFTRNQIAYALVFEVEPGLLPERIQALESVSGQGLEVIEQNACEGVATPEKNP